MRGGTRDDFTHGSDDAPRAAGRLLIVRSVDDVVEARRLLAGARVVGVDVEGVTRRGQPMLPVLLQLGTARAAILIDLLESTDATAAAGKLVAEVLASPAVVKVGVNLAKDVDELFDEAPSLGLARLALCARLVDLSGAFASALGVSHADAIGLKRLALLLLGLKLDRAMARSDWSCRPLSDAQVNYAAVDAQAGARCFDAIEEIARAGLDVRVDARSGGGVACSVRYAGVLLLRAHTNTLTSVRSSTAASPPPTRAVTVLACRSVATPPTPPTPVGRRACRGAAPLPGEPRRDRPLKEGAGPVQQHRPRRRAARSSGDGGASRLRHRRCSS